MSEARLGRVCLAGDAVLERRRIARVIPLRQSARSTTAGALSFFCRKNYRKLPETMFPGVAAERAA